MHYRFIYRRLVLASLLLVAASGMSWAATATPAATSKLVDINHANVKTLLTLPNLTEAQANKIIASRPFGSKSWLLTKDIISAEQYAAIKDLVVANQAIKKPKKTSP
ncbi:MAG: hypothetical protein COW02_09780 [Comamonadaceae bacterium CG12_big_fil_rev_8_21_14_0_65_59_15]|nr:MAG: hypothetical protein COW02_09780 [Comamonadaceae bacterium CG12_big_fil_rev_8_21_14_0_65_59_15]